MAAPTTRRPRARRGEGDKLRDELLEVAEQLLLKAGSEDAVSVRAIADAARCTPPSIYLHFADKDELFMAVCERRFAELDRYGEEAGATVDDPLESLKERGRAYVRFGLEHPEHYRLLMMTPRSSSRSGPGLPAPGSVGMAAFEHLVGAVQRCIDSGVFAAEPDAWTVAITLWASVHGLTSLLITFPAFEWGNRDQLLEFALDVQIEGLLAT